MKRALALASAAATASGAAVQLLQPSDVPTTVYAVTVAGEPRLQCSHGAAAGVIVRAVLDELEVAAVRRAPSRTSPRTFTDPRRIRRDTRRAAIARKQAFLAIHAVTL